MTTVNPNNMTEDEHKLHREAFDLIGEYMDEDLTLAEFLAVVESKGLGPWVDSLLETMKITTIHQFRRVPR